MYYTLRSNCIIQVSISHLQMPARIHNPSATSASLNKADIRAQGTQNLEQKYTQAKYQVTGYK